jgi:hypothetical protein
MPIIFGLIILATVIGFKPVLRALFAYAFLWVLMILVYAAIFMYLMGSYLLRH